MNTYNATRHKDRIIKICGMKEPDNIRRVAWLTPMLMGFIFYEKSPRYAGNLDTEVVKGLPKFIKPVGVFVNTDPEEVEETCNKYGITTIQLHGEESPEECRELKEKGFKVFKAFGIRPPFNWEDLREYEVAVDMFVFDTFCQAKGGSGRKFDWALLDDYPLSTPYLLSGGIGPDDTDKILKAMRPKMAGIDLNSRFETEPGVKDIHKLTHFILSLRSYNEE